MFYKVNDTSIRFTGRWDITEKAATTTAAGGMIEVGFSGTAAVLYFDMEMNMHPYPHLWISVDGGAKIETAVDHVLRVEAPGAGNHVVRVIYKSAVEEQHRWYKPLIGKLRFTGFEAEGTAPLPEDKREIIEFIGDSITEGVLIDAMYTFEQYNQNNRPNQDDSTATYAYLTAMELGMKPVIMGYGAVGVTKSGCGSVPKAAEAYPYNFDGSPAKAQNPAVIVINHGANDRRQPVDLYVSEYRNLLKVVRKINPDARIVVLSAFCGVYPRELTAMVEEFNRENNDSVYFIDSTGWIPEEPLHPLRDGHRIVARHLTEELRKIL
ncbi:MAG: hypothetical protein IJN25_07240 [Clostridia bacterium]|nr:hypothetical protein [Clostridia bacterium]